MLPVPGFPDRQEWLAHAGVTGINTDPGQRFNLSNMAIQAAVASVGVLLGDDFAASRLIRPFEDNFSSRFRYFLLSDSRITQDGGICAVHDRLLAEARAPA